MNYRLKPAAKYAIISNPVQVADDLFGGHIVSRHRTLRGMASALERHQAPTRRANPGCHLDLQPAEMVDRHHGRLLGGNSEEWLSAQFEQSNAKNR